MKTLLRALALGTLGVGLLAGCGGSTAPEGSGGAGGGVGAEEGRRTVWDLAEGERVRVEYDATLWTARRVGDSLFALDIDVTNGRILNDDEELDDLVGGIIYAGLPWGPLSYPGEVPYAQGRAERGATWGPGTVKWDAVIQAMDDIMAVAPGIRFRPRVDGDVGWLEFIVEPGNRGQSPVGPQGNSNYVRIGQDVLDGTAANTFTAHHEIFHSLGAWHEQNRPDRNAYVGINYFNMKDCPSTATSSGDCVDDSVAVNYDPKTCAHMIGPYDVRSIMEYGPGGPPDCDKGPCITQLDPPPPPIVIGNRARFSDGDEDLLRAMYPEEGSIEMTISRYIPYGVNTPMCQLEGAAEGMLLSSWGVGGELRSQLRSPARALRPRQQRRR